MTIDTLLQARELQWRQVPDLAIALYEKTAEIGKQAQELLRYLPMDDLVSVHYSPSAELFKLATRRDNLADGHDLRQKVATALQHLAPTLALDNVKAQPDDFVPILLSPQASFLKRAEGFAFDKPLRMAGQMTGFFPSPLSHVLPAWPSPAAATLAGGLLGAGVGYGTGWLAEKMLPERWERGRMRKTLAVLGGLAGASPGAAGLYAHYQVGLSPFAAGPWGAERANFVTPEMEASSRASSLPAPSPAPGDAGKTVLAAYDDTYNDQVNHVMDPTHSLDWPAIDVDEVNRTVWDDPQVANRLNPPQQAAISGLVTGSSYDRGKKSKWISPMDVGRMAAGMGAGYVSGALVGKALGLMFGMPEETQDTLKQTGMFAGLLGQLGPIAFGG